MTPERRPCACRGSLQANPADLDDVEQAVKGHQRELQHLAWRAREQLAGRLMAPEQVGLIAPMQPRVRRLT